MISPHPINCTISQPLKTIKAKKTAQKFENDPQCGGGNGERGGRQGERGGQAGESGNPQSGKGDMRGCATRAKTKRNNIAKLVGARRVI